jgi:predicted permease
LNRDIDEELESHIAEAIENGRDPAQARAAFGSALRWREESRDIRLAVWLDSVRADLVFGWRQLVKRKVTSAAAIVSLGLGIGACTAAFRLIDALLLRPLPISGSDRLYLVARQGAGPSGDLRISESCEYPLFQLMRAAVTDQADLLAVSYADRVDLTYSSDEEMEKAYRQYVSGSMFSSFGLRPTAGRLFTEADDTTPGAHPFVVISFDYWSRRFGRDPGVVGRKVRIGNDLFEVIGVGPERFTGTEPGTVIDVFVPTMMNPYVGRSDASWFRVLALLKPGVAVEPLRARLHSMTRSFNEQRAKGWSGQTKLFVNRFLDQTILLEPSPSGASGMQRSYQSSLIVLGVLVALVLLIACLNVANLLTAQAAARAREIALRISIGAGPWRLAQLVLAESAWLGILAATIGTVFAWWAAPFVVSRINPPDNPARLFLPLDLRVVFFGIGLTFAVTFLFGLIPALRASSVKPASALKGGEDPHSRRRLMYALIAAQVAFCFIVQFAAGLFVATFDRLAHQPTGFSSERVVVVDVAFRQPQPPAAWDEVAEHLRTLAGVDKVAMAGWPLLGGTGWNGFIWVNGASTDVLGYFLAVSPGWMEAMNLRFVDGRDLRPTDVQPRVAIVNEAFVRQCFGGQNPVGRSFEKETGDGVSRDRYEVVGVVKDARYRNMREPITPTAYVPFRSVNAKGALQRKASGAFIVRTLNANPMALASVLRREVPRARPEFRVSNVRSQQELNQQHTVRERLLAMLAVFFALVALLLSGIGLYGVLDYSVVQRRRELGIRLAIGAQAGEIARRVTTEVFAMVLTGAVAGLVLGLMATRSVATLLYQVKATDAVMLSVPVVVIVAAALLASLPAVLRAVRIDPVAMLRAE